MEECREQLLTLKDVTGVKLASANALIARCTYSNFGNGWINAPGHAKNIQKGRYGYEIKFGANYFLIGLAISRCVDTLSKYLDARVWMEKYHDTGAYYEDSDFEKYNAYLDFDKKLILHIRGAVANNDGFEYKGHYPIDSKNRMIFGASSIDVKKLVNMIVETSQIKDLPSY